MFCLPIRLPRNHVDFQAPVQFNRSFEWERCDFLHSRLSAPRSFAMFAARVAIATINALKQTIHGRRCNPRAKGRSRRGGRYSSRRTKRSFLEWPLCRPALGASSLVLFPMPNPPCPLEPHAVPENVLARTGFRRLRARARARRRSQNREGCSTRVILFSNFFSFCVNTCVFRRGTVCYFHLLHAAFRVALLSPLFGPFSAVLFAVKCQAVDIIELISGTNFAHVIYIGLAINQHYMAQKKRTLRCICHIFLFFVYITKNPPPPASRNISAAFHYRCFRYIVVKRVMSIRLKLISVKINIERTRHARFHLAGRKINSFR